MNFAQLAAFGAVARERSFSKAAKKLYRTQPAVSQAVRALEEDIGEPLFLRLGRRIEITQAGYVLLEHAEQAFGALELARNRIEALRGLQEGTLTIGASDTTACYVLPHALSAFRGKYPGIEIVITNRTSPVVLNHVLAHEVDVGIVTLPIDDERVNIRELLVREDVVICPPQHPFATRKRLRLSELAGQPLLLLDRGASTRHFVDARLVQAGVTPQVAMELGSIEVIKRMVQLGFGVSIVPRVAVETEVERGELCAIRVFAMKEARRLGAIYPKRGYLSIAAKEFLKMFTRTQASSSQASR